MQHIFLKVRDLHHLVNVKARNRYSFIIATLKLLPEFSAMSLSTKIKEADKNSAFVRNNSRQIYHTSREAVKGVIKSKLNIMKPHN